MDSPGINNCSVSLMRCDDILQIPPLNTGVIKSVNIVSMDSSDTAVSSKTTELKRSARLSKKRSLQDNSVIKITDRLDDSNEAGKQSKILKSNKTKLETYATPKNGNKKCNNRNSVMSTVTASSELSNVSNVQPSLNIVVDNGEKIHVKSLPKAFKNKNSSKRPTVTRVKNESTVYDANTAAEDELGSKREKSDDLVKLTRKRGRRSQKELQLFLRDGTDKVNTSCEDDEVDRQKNGKGFSEPADYSFDVYESDSTTTPNGADRTPTSAESNNFDDGPSKPKRKRIGIKSSTTDVEIVGNDSCLSADGMEPVKVVPAKTISEHDEVLADADEPQPSRDETFDREIALVSNRFNVPHDTLRNIIERESVPVFREKYSDTVTPSMVTVSPVVSMTDRGKRKWGRNSDGAGASAVEYKIEPIRVSVAYGKTNLEDTMREISKAMPSWSLSVVADPPRYVISHMSIETYGTPFADKAVVLDRHFRASVYIDQRLEYKYCKRYTTASEIVDLIKQLDAIK